jgi:hypothetical protein
MLQEMWEMGRNASDGSKNLLECSYCNGYWGNGMGDMLIYQDGMVRAFEMAG